jgi:DNA ligase-associated metallophosphoesterase
MHHPLTLGSALLHALPSGALHWPAQGLLVVSDLHLGKSARLARRGGALLPPYETRATLEKLDADIAATAPRQVICLGDSFDDLTAGEEMDEADALWLSRLMAGRDWTWIEGNHDPGPMRLGGAHRAQAQVGGLTFRHIADPAQRLEVSGHFHPKARLVGQARPCFLADADRIILPAYGAYTGGLWASDPGFGFLRPEALAVLTGHRALAIPARS